MATSKAFGYLLIDLKPDTPNDKRLWPNVFEQTSTVLQQNSHNSTIQSRKQVATQKNKQW